MEFYSVIKQKMETLPLITTLMKLEAMMLSEIKLEIKNEYCAISLLSEFWKKKNKKLMQKQRTDQWWPEAGG